MSGKSRLSRVKRAVLKGRAALLDTRRPERQAQSTVPVQDSIPTGFVERIETDVIEGWVGGPGETGASFELIAGDARIAFHPERWTRPDVVAVHGAAFLESGFRWKPDPLARALIDSASGALIPISVRLGQSVLPSVDPREQPQHAFGRETVLAGTPGTPALSWGFFRIRGFVSSASASIALRIAGREFSCLIERPGPTERLDVRHPFEIEIPVDAWRLADQGPTLTMDVVIDEAVAVTLVLDAARLSRWLEGIAALPEGMERQYLAILGLDHLRASGMQGLLEDRALSAACLLARQLRLQDLVFPDGLPGEADDSEKRPSSHDLAMRRAMRDLNDTLCRAGPDVPLAGIVREVLDRQALSSESLIWFGFLVTQLACERGEFRSLLPLLDPHFLTGEPASDSPDHVSLSLPVLLARGEVSAAAAALTRLASTQRWGWLHTACIRDALAECRRMLLAGLCDATQAGALRTAFLLFVDECNGEWFSRHHDLQVVRAMVEQLADARVLADSDRAQVLCSAIRNFGLSPTFWERLVEADLVDAHHELAQASRYWQDIAAFVSEPCAEAGRLQSVVRSLRWFLRCGNRDALVFMREVLVYGLARSGETACEHLAELAEELATCDRAEVLRCALLPDVPGHRVQAVLAGVSSRLEETLRLACEGGVQTAYEQQLSAAAALSSAITCTDSGQRLAALRELELLSVQLDVAASGALGFDMLVSAATLAAASGLPWQQALMHARRIGTGLARASDPELRLAAPLIAGISRLLAHTDPEFAALGAELQSFIRDPDDGAPTGIASCVAEGGELLPGWPSDTLFVVFPAGLSGDSREDARLGWQRALSGRGVPCLFLSEGDAAVLEGDRLVLPRSSGPAWLLDLVRWVDANTPAQYLVLVEDRCEIATTRYLDSLSYRKHHYYGARVSSAFAPLDRAPLSADAALDRSPEPSEWVDGSGAVSLSRLALERIGQVLDGGAGRRLVASSRCPFKLLGDLLALGGIRPSDENHIACQRETAAGGRVGRSRGHHTLFRGESSPTMVFRPASTAEAAQVSPDRPWPPRVWPSCAVPSLRRNANQLEVISDVAKQRRLLAEQLAVVAVVRNEMTMLPHFLAHYRKLGVRAFLMADNCSDDGTLDYLAAQPDVMLFSCDTEYKRSHYGVSWQQAILGNFCLGKWVVLADADELLVFRDCETRGIGEFVSELDTQGFDAAPVYMVDMYPWGDLADACFEHGDPFEVAPYFDREPLIELRFGGGNFSNSRNFVSALRHRVAPSRINAYVSQKFAVFRHAPWVRLGEGLHYAANLRFGQTCGFFAHFKYHAGFKQKVQTEIRRGQHFNNAEEYARYAGMLAEGGGGFGVDGVSVRYEGSRSFQAILDPQGAPA